MQRDRAAHVPQGPGVLEGHDARERDVESQCHGRVGHRLGLGKTVHHAPYFGRTLLSHDGERVLGGLARMDNEGLPAFARGAYVAPKALALPLEIAAYPEIVEARFADRHHARMARELDEPRRIHLSAVLVVRMHADCREEIVVSLVERPPLRKPAESEADAHPLRHAAHA